MYSELCKALTQRYLQFTQGKVQA